MRVVLRYFARATGGDRRVAEDLRQETFVAALRAFERDREVPTVAWLMAVARNKLTDHYRKVHRDNRNLCLAWSERPWSDSAPAADELDSQTILAVMSRLSDEHRIVLFMRYFEDRSIKETASATGSSVHAIESALARARRALAPISFS